MSEFKERLQELIEDKGLNQKQLSIETQISKSTINDYFNRTQYPSISNAIKIAKYCPEADRRP